MNEVFGKAIRTAALALTIATPAHAGDDGPRERIRRAAADMIGCSSDAAISGRATLWERPSNEGVKTVEIRLHVRGLTPGKHAVHIHETAACVPCGAAKGHFDPGPVGMTNPDGNHPFHSGDLVNIRVKDNGHGYLRTRTTRITLSEGPLSLFDRDGSAFIIHVRPDTYCPEGVEAGCAGGARVACGIIYPVYGQGGDADD